MFSTPKTIVGLSPSNQTLHLTFLENGESLDAATTIPSWCHVYVNFDRRATLPVFVANGHHVQIIVRAAEAPGARRAVYVRYGAVQRVLEARTRPAVSPPPAPARCHRTSSWDTSRRIILESARPPRRINGRRSRDPIDRACPRTRGARDASATRRIPTRRRCVRAPAVETSSFSSTPATPWVKRYFTGR